MPITNISSYVYQDSFGNTYLNTLDDPGNGFSITGTEIDNFITSAYGTDYFRSSSLCCVRLPDSNETSTGTVSGNNFRFRSIHPTANASSAMAISTQNTGTTTNLLSVSVSTTASFYGVNTTNVIYGVANSSSLFFAWNKSGTWVTTGFCWLNNRLFTDLSTKRFNHCLVFYGSNFLLPTAVNSPTNRTITQDANWYSVVCANGQTPTSDLWATNIVIRDNNSPNYAIGTVPSNLLLGVGSSFTLGQIYKINPSGTINAIGENLSPANTNSSPNTDTNYYLCCRSWGTNKFWLMRVTPSIL